MWRGAIVALALAGFGVGLALAFERSGSDGDDTAVTAIDEADPLASDPEGPTGSSNDDANANDDEPTGDMTDDMLGDTMIATVNDAENDAANDDAGDGAGDGCVVEARSMGIGASGPAVVCLQSALAAAGFYSGPIDGEYGSSTAQAVERLQTERKLFIDGVAGRETALSLGIWPDEPMTVVRTPIPAPGATDDLGYRLSSVAVAGADAPPLPANSGSGRRVVYERQSQRVWAVDGNERVVRSWLVAGSRFTNEVPGTHRVYSRSETSIAWDGTYRFNKMVRWYDSTRGALGFHSIPYDAAGRPQMTEAELGERLSAGCQRQADLDADFLWDFAPVGTTVVVL